MRKIASTLMAAVLGAVSPGAAQQAAPSPPSVSAAALSEKAAAGGGSLRVIVRLKAVPPRGSDAETARANRRASDGVVADVLGPGRAVSHMTFAPMFATRATAAEIARLAADPRVASVTEDGLSQP